MKHQQEFVSVANVRALDPLDTGPSEVLTLLKRNRGVIAATVLLSLMAGVAYLFVTPSEYTARALLLIDSRSNVRPSSQVRATDANSESAYVETQVGVLKSERIARIVIAEQRLYERPEFKDPVPPLSRAAAQDEVAQAEAAQAAVSVPEATKGPLPLDLVPAKAVREFGRRMEIKRSQSTYIVDISFAHRDPQVAADIANAIAHAYLEERLNAREEAIRSASTWLQQRSLDLRRQTQAAETALDEFRNNSAAPGSSRSALRELESTAQTHRLIGESFHKQFLETSQEQYFSPLDARIVSQAWAPSERSHPRRSFVLAVSAGLGLAIGFLIALVRGDGRRRTPRDAGP